MGARSLRLWRTLKEDARRSTAYLAALHHQGGAHEATGAIVGDDAALLRLAADALEGKFEPTERRRILEAYLDASHHAAVSAIEAETGRKMPGIDFELLTTKEKWPPPSVLEVQEQFVRQSTAPVLPTPDLADRPTP